MTADLFDVLGRRIRRLENDAYPAGLVTLTWDGRGEDGTLLSNGVYLLRIGSVDGLRKGSYPVVLAR